MRAVLYIIINSGTVPNLDFIHIDGGDNENWKKTNRDKMYLENFLTEDDDGELRFVVNESLISFGVGRRDCVGRRLYNRDKSCQYVLKHVGKALTQSIDC